MGPKNPALAAFSLLCFGFFSCCREQPIQGSKKEELKRFQADSGIEFLASLPIKVTFSDEEINRSWKIYKKYTHEFRWHRETFIAIKNKDKEYWENVFKIKYNHTEKKYYTFPIIKVQRKFLAKIIIHTFIYSRKRHFTSYG